MNAPTATAAGRGARVLLLAPCALAALLLSPPPPALADEPADDAPADEPDDNAPADEPADDAPADEPAPTDDPAPSEPAANEPASAGPTDDPAPPELAPRSPREALADAYTAVDSGFLDAARDGFHEYLDGATDEGAKWRVRLDLAYLEERAGNLYRARQLFETIAAKSPHGSDRRKAADAAADLADRPRHDAAAMAARAEGEPELCAPALHLFDEAERILAEDGGDLAPLYLDRAYLHWACFDEDAFWADLDRAEELGDEALRATVQREREARATSSEAPAADRRLLSAASLQWRWRGDEGELQLPAARPLPEGTEPLDLSRKRTYQLMEAAWKLKRQERWAEAELHFRAALDKEPKRQQEVHAELGYIALALREDDAAHLWFRSVARGPDLARAARAELELQALGARALASREYDKALAWGQPRQRVELTRGYDALAAGDRTAARRWFEAAATLPEGDDVEVDWYWLREANEQLLPLLSPTERRAWKRTDLLTRPPEPATEAPQLKGWTAAETLDEARRLLAAHQLGLAKLVFAKAKRRGADRAEVALGLGQVALIERDLPEAQAQFTAAAEAADKATSRAARAELKAMAGRWMFLGSQLAAAGQPDEAVAAYEKARKAGHPADLVDLSLAWLLAARGDETEARVLFARLVDSELPEVGSLALAEMEIRTPLWVLAAREELAAGHIPAATGAFLAAPTADELGPWARRQLLGLTGCEPLPTDSSAQAAYKEEFCPQDVAGLQEYAVQRLIMGELLIVNANRDVTMATLRQARADGVQPQADRADATIALAAITWLAQAQRNATTARRTRSDDDLFEAVKFYEIARGVGADSQQIDLELGWLHKALDDYDTARVHFTSARDDGDDAALARAARAELKSLPRLFWGDLYGEVYAWHRFHPVPARSNLVPLLRVRGYLHPIPHVDLDPYVYFRISRDVASRAADPVSGFPVILADNTMSFGGGVQFRFWERRVVLWAQLGPVFHLVPRVDRPRVELEARAGAALQLEAPTCKPAALRGAAQLVLEPCAEVYGSAVWIGRSGDATFDARHNVYFFVRGRAGFHYLVTGPVAWGPFIEGRLLADVAGDFYNNLADAGVGHRWRLLEPFGLDLLLGVHAGSYLGRENLDRAPDPLTFAELRLLLVTYFDF